jgi:hypothetical protein
VSGSWPVAAVEDLARAYHEMYRSRAGADGAPALPSWAELPEWRRESNRATARALRDELERRGYRLLAAGDEGASSSGAGDGGAGDGVRALPTDLVERMARDEHVRWRDERTALGYVYGPERRDDTAPRTHPDMVDWSSLDHEAREKDRVRFSQAPRLLAGLGYVLLAPG